jgi:hypothetical protein
MATRRYHVPKGRFAGHLSDGLHQIRGRIPGKPAQYHNALTHRFLPWLTITEIKQICCHKLIIFINIRNTSAVSVYTQDTCFPIKARPCC